MKPGDVPEEVIDNGLHDYPLILLADFVEVRRRPLREHPIVVPALHLVLERPELESSRKRIRIGPVAALHELLLNECLQDGVRVCRRTGFRLETRLPEASLR